MREEYERWCCGDRLLIQKNSLTDWHFASDLSQCRIPIQIFFLQTVISSECLRSFKLLWLFPRYSEHFLLLHHHFTGLGRFEAPGLHFLKNSAPYQDGQYSKYLPIPSKVVYVGHSHSSRSSPSTRIGIQCMAFCSEEISILTWSFISPQSATCWIFSNRSISLIRLFSVSSLGGRLSASLSSSLTIATHSPGDESHNYSRPVDSVQSPEFNLMMKKFNL